MLHKDPQREDSLTSEKLNWFQVGIPFIRVPMYQVYANLLPFLKRNLELISCVTPSEEACIFITCAYFFKIFHLSITLSDCSVANQADEYVLLNI